MEHISKIISDKLLEIKAIKLSTKNYFTWASGWFSPIYCDNRKTLSFPKIRNLIRDSFIEIINENFNNFDVIAGVATGAIAHGVLVADKMEKPFIYVRPQAKTHGMENQIEGDLQKGQKVLVIEDLISTGSSSMNAINAIKDFGCVVVGMVAIFSYNFTQAFDCFEKNEINLYTLTNYNDLINRALKIGNITKEDVQMLKEWRISPETWNK